MKNNYTQTEKKNWNALYSSHYTSSNHVTKPAWEPINTLAELLKQDYPFNSQEWPRQNFSLQYQYNVNQISDENKENINLRIITV